MKDRTSVQGEEIPEESEKELDGKTAQMDSETGSRTATELEPPVSGKLLSEFPAGFFRPEQKWETVHHSQDCHL